MAHHHHRDPNPDPTGPPVFWFRTRKDNKDGPLLDNGGRDEVVPGDPTVGVYPLGLLPSASPTVHQIKKELFGKRRHKIDFYYRHRDDSPESNSTVVDMSKHGLTRSTPFLFVDRNDDAEEQNEEALESQEIQGGGGYTGQYQQYTAPPPPRTTNICGNPDCGRTFICAADYNRTVQPMGYPGV